MKIFLKKVYDQFSALLPKESEKKIANDAGQYWSKSEESKKIQDLSHWRGAGRWNEGEWQKIGEHHFTLLKRLCTYSNISLESVRSMLEWGPGGGSNVVRFSENMSTIYGVDISRSNLDECSRQLEKINFKKFYPVLIPPEDPDSCLNQIKEPVDLFLSTAVFQHFPSKEYGIRIMSVAYELLKPGAVAIIQIRYDNSKRHYHSKKRNYRHNAVTFTSYGLDEFWDICASIKFTPLYIHLESAINYAYYYLRKD